MSFKDVTIDCLHSPQVVKVHLKASKTDPFRVGVNIFVGKTGNDLCPVTALLCYMVARGDGPGPFFHFKDGKPLSKARFVSEIKDALAVAGIDATAYSGHSFRSGAATIAAKQCNHQDARTVEELCLSTLHKDCESMLPTDLSESWNGT